MGAAARTAGMRILAFLTELALAGIEELALATVELRDLGPEILVNSHALGLALALALVRAGMHDRCCFGSGARFSLCCLAEPPAFATGHGVRALCPLVILRRSLGATIMGRKSLRGQRGTSHL